MEPANGRRLPDLKLSEYDLLRRVIDSCQRRRYPARAALQDALPRQFADWTNAIDKIQAQDAWAVAMCPLSLEQFLAFCREKGRTSSRGALFAAVPRLSIPEIEVGEIYSDIDTNR